MQYGTLQKPKTVIRGENLLDKLLFLFSLYTKSILVALQN